MTEENRYTIDATEVSLTILETLAAATDPIGVTALADRLDVSKSVAHNHLSTLRARGYVINRGGKYKSSLRPLSLGERTRMRISIYEAARKEVANLAEATGETAVLFVLEANEGVPVYVSEPDEGWSPRFVVGDRMPLHVNAPGKAILASLPDERIEGILDSRNLSGLTDETITDRTELRKQLSRTRDVGTVFCREEQFRGVVGVAVPVTVSGDTLPAAIGVIGSADRLTGRYLKEDVTGQVLSAVKSVRVNFAES